MTTSTITVNIIPPKKYWHVGRGEWTEGKVTIGTSVKSSEAMKNIIAYSHQGQRDYQEDNIRYGADFLIVADGVGGLAKGEKAAEIVTATAASYIRDYPTDLQSIQVWTRKLIQTILQNLNAYATKHPEAWGMGSTMALVLQVDDILFAIHIGDSRIYHFSQNGQLLWQSRDHSFVQELIDARVITEEEASVHPKRNIITRVLQAKENNETRADIHQLENVQSGDILLVCSDGVNEAWQNEKLASLMASPDSMKEKLEIIKNHCTKHSNDNNSAILAEVDCASSNQTNITRNTKSDNTSFYHRVSKYYTRIHKIYKSLIN